MIQKIVDLLDVTASEAFTVGKAWGLVARENVKDQIRTVKYVGGGQAEVVNTDSNGSWSYWRLTGPLRKTYEKELSGCDNAYSYSIPLRYFIAVERKVCSDLATRLTSLVWDESAIGTELNAQRITLPSGTIEVDRDRAIQAELTGSTVPLEIAMAYVDVLLVVTIEDQCLTNC